MPNKEFDSAKTLVFWDIQDCPIPDNIEPYDVSATVRKTLRVMGNSGMVDFWAYGDVKHLMKDSYEGFYIVPTEDEDERLQRILVTLFGEAVRNRGQSLNFVLILGDISGQMDFLSALHLLKSRRHYNVFLVQPQNGSGQIGYLITQSKTSDDNIGSWISICQY